MTGCHHLDQNARRCAASYFLGLGNTKRAWQGVGEERVARALVRKIPGRLLDPRLLFNASAVSFHAHLQEKNKCRLEQARPCPSAVRCIRGQRHVTPRSGDQVGRGTGSRASVYLSGELFLAKRFTQMCVQALCFGDFHLGQQMKVTRLPAGTGAPCKGQKNQQRAR